MQFGSTELAGARKKNIKICAARTADFNKPTEKVFTSAIYNGRRYQQDVNSSRETNHSGGKQT